MGIRGFAKFYSPCFEERNFNDYRGNRVGVDASGKAHQYAIAIRNSGSDMRNARGESVNHLYAMASCSRFYLRHGLVPTLLFDNKAPDIKKNTLEDRKKQKQRSQTVCRSIDDKMSPEYLKHYKRSFILKERDNYESQRLLTAMGIPFVQCIGEADPQCAAFSCDDTVLGIIGEDTDILVFGTKLLLKDFSGKKKKVKEISMHKILSFLKTKANAILDANNRCKLLTFIHENFVDFSIIMGTDYTPHIKGFTNEQLFEYFVLANLDVPTMINTINIDLDQRQSNGESTHQYIIPTDFIVKWRQARQYYMDVKVIHPRNIKKDMSKPNKSEIIKILCDENNFDRECVSDMADELMEMYLAFKGVLTDSNEGFKSFKSYQLKYQHNKHNKPINRQRHHKLFLDKNIISEAKIDGIALKRLHAIYDISEFDIHDIIDADGDTNMDTNYENISLQELEGMVDT